MQLKDAFVEAIRAWYNDHEYEELSKNGVTPKYNQKYFKTLENKEIGVSTPDIEEDSEDEMEGLEDEEELA